MDDGEITKKVLKSLHTYLQDNLPASKDFISRLYGKGLLDETDADQLVALADKGDKQCIHRLLDYMSSYYVDKTLEDFCIFLEEYSKPARPRLHAIAETIRKDMKLQQTTLMQQQHDQQHHQDDIPGPSGVNRPPGVVGGTQPQRPLFLPVIGELKSPFSDLATAVLSTIKSLSKEALEALCMHLSNFLNPDIPRMAPPPPVPRVFDQLVPFLQARWDPLQIHILQEIVRKLRKKELTSQLKKYEKTLKNKVSDFLSGCKTPKILHKKLPQHTSVAVTMNPTPQEISLSRILELKDFFIANLGLPDTLFTGFSEGSTILFFSIPEDSVWCLPTCLHPSNLPQLEEWKVVSLSVEGSFTVDIIESRVFDVVNMESLSKKDHLIGDLKAKVSLWKGKVYVLEDILSHHKEVPFEGEKYSSQHPTLVKGKSEPLSKASKPGDVPESEPWTMKPKLEGPDYPDVKTKLETKSEVEATHSEIRIKSEVETMGSALGPGPHPELETVESALRLGTHPELETVGSALRPGPHPELSLFKKDHLIEDLKTEVSLWKGKVYVLEDIRSSHKEGPFEGEKYSSEQPTLVKVKSEPLSKASKPEDVPESEPWTKKSKLGGPDNPDVKPKLETKSKGEVTHSKIGIKSELETGESALRLGTHPVYLPTPLKSEVVATHSEIGIKSEVETMKSVLRLETHPEVETVESALGPGPHPEVQDNPPEPHSDVKGKGKKLPTTHDVLSTQFTPSSLVTPGPAHHSMLFEEEKLKVTHLYWRKQPDVLEEVCWPTAVYLNDKIFVGDRWRGSYDHFLCVFSVVSRTWSKVPFHDSCEMCGFTLATATNQAHTLGGGWRKDGKGEECSKVVFSLDDNMKWSNTLPPLNIGRRYATSTSFEDVIVVAGGVGRNGDLSSVEVLDSSQLSSTWWEICDLPVKSYLMQCTVTDNELFIGCGDGTDNTVYTAKLSAVKESLIPSDPKSSISPESFWQSLPKTPLKWSGLVAVNNCLVSVGGHDYDGKPHSSVDLYDCYKKTWTKVSDIRKSRDSPAVVVCTFENKQELFVLCRSDADTSVESCELF